MCAIWSAAAPRHLAGLDLVNKVAEVDVNVTYSHRVPREVGAETWCRRRSQKVEGEKGEAVVAMERVVATLAEQRVKAQFHESGKILVRLGRSQILRQLKSLNETNRRARKTWRRLLPRGRQVCAVSPSRSL